MHELQAEIIIIGGGLGGCAAALAAASASHSVILTEETDWVGGQLTSQAVPPDENAWIEQFGGTMLYHKFRNAVREYYRRNYPLAKSAKSQVYFNPGNGSVSRLCFEPKVALSVLYDMLEPYIHSGNLRVLLNQRLAKVDVLHDRIAGVTMRHVLSDERQVLVGKIFLDATELGELIQLSGAEYVTGTESRAQTGELHAPEGAARPLNMQAFVMCFAMDYRPGEHHIIDRPATYQFWKDYIPKVHPEWPGKLLSWTAPRPSTLKPARYTLFKGSSKETSLWEYRRIIDCTNFEPGTFESDITLVNWPQNDYFLGPLYEPDGPLSANHLNAARDLSLSLLYWLQTEAPRPDGGAGYPGLRIRPDIVGTRDGLAKYPYIRESRRLKALFTVREHDVGIEMRGQSTAERFFDSVGIGHYRIDLHPTTEGDNYIDIPCAPFEIPVRSLIPIRLLNLLAACKNIGTTHITNGCYRLHPIEWNIGESAGHLAAYCVENHVDAATVCKGDQLETYQKRLTAAGIVLHWATPEA